MDHSTYKRLPVLEHFDLVSDLSRYRELPDDWYIIVADVTNSTHAVRSGRYKSVNLVGVSIISALLNIAGQIEIPYIFGGDGASLCIPPHLLEPSRLALIATRTLAWEAFALELRVGILPIATVREAGLQLLCAKHRVSAYCTQAAFAGGGIEYAETLLKSDSDRIDRLVTTDQVPEANYSGLECRWDNVPSRHGETIALIVRSLAPTQQEQAQFYRQVIERIRRFYGDDQLCRPVTESGLHPTFNNSKLAPELRLKTLHGGIVARWKLALLIRAQNLLGWIFMHFGLTIAGVNWANYKPDLVHNTDFRKFDGVLRQVLSGTAAQREQLDGYLQQQFGRKRCVYGIHRSDSALITCLVSSRSGNHYHFVDGADGGYALAALAMKQQIKSIQSNTI